MQKIKYNVSTTQTANFKVLDCFTLPKNWPSFKVLLSIQNMNLSGEIREPVAGKSSDLEEGQPLSINPFAVIIEVRNIFLRRFPDMDTTVGVVNEAEVFVALKMFEAYSEIIIDSVLEEDEELNVAEMQDVPNLNLLMEELSDSDEQEFESQESWKMTESQDSQTNHTIPHSTVLMDRKKKIVQLWKDHPKWKLKTLQKNGAKEVKNKATLYTWKKQIERGDNKYQKYKAIDEYVVSKLRKARERSKILRSSHLMHWAIEKWLQFHDSGRTFKASNSWVDRFKKKHRIASRKITRLVSKREVRSAEEIAARVTEFQDAMKALIPTYPPELVFNTDQCGFNYELLSQRTLTHKSEKIVLGFAQSPTNLVTHSYTVQYIINVVGQVFPKVFVCLQEVTGKLGPNVKKDIEAFCPSNVALTCSTSGKLSTSLTEYFLKTLVAENVHENFIWIVDSWPGHTNKSTYDKVFGEANNRPECTIKIIPEKSTSFCQPFDTTFHRQLKVLAREILAALQIIDCSTTSHPEESWTNRKGVIKLQSLLHHQMSAPIFEPMVKYSWYFSGLVQEQTTFKNVKQVCFTFESREPLTREGFDCTKLRFLKCARCRKRLCLNHFWFENHYNFCKENSL